MKIVHVITGLGQGGAENMLFKLISNSIDDVEHAVISLKGEGVFGEKLKALNIRVICLELNKPYKLKWLTRFVPFIWRYKPDIIQGWMYHSNVFVALFKPFLPKFKMIFNIRQSIHGNSDKLLTRFVIFLNAKLSSNALRVINNSRASIDQHYKVGFDRSNSIYIGNGFDLDRFVPNEIVKSKFRLKHQINAETVILGNIARFHPKKNHLGLIEAFAQLRRMDSNVVLVIAGTNVDATNSVLVEKIQEYDVEHSCILLGAVDAAEMLPAFDIYISSSGWGEGFPNVLGEALACGVPCVSTDVGDSAAVVGNCGIVTAVGKSSALAEAAFQLIKTRGEYSSQICRRDIEQNYSIDRISQEYINLYKQV